MLTFEEVKTINQEFMYEYRIPPFGEYITGFGITKLGAIIKNAPKKRANEWCIKVLLRKELPEELKFPDEYKGVHVTSEYVGTITLIK